MQRPVSGPGSNPKCCTSDLTLAEFKSLKAKMDASNPSATTAEGYLGGTASWRTDLYTGRGTLVTLRESLALNERNGVKHTPELKGGDPARINQVFGSQARYAQKAIDELNEAGVEPRDVFLQSFNKDDVLYWIRHGLHGTGVAPSFAAGRRADRRPSSRRSARNGQREKWKALHMCGMHESLPDPFGVGVMKQ